MPKSVNPFLPNDEFADLPEIQALWEAQQRQNKDYAATVSHPEDPRMKAAENEPPIEADTSDKPPADLSDLREAIRNFAWREYAEELPNTAFSDLSRIWIAETTESDREDITISMAVNVPSTSLDQYVNGTKTDTWRYSTLRDLVDEIKHISFDDLVEKGPNAEAMVNKLMDVKSPELGDFVLPNMTFALYQMRWEDSLHELRFLPMDYLQTQALAFRGKVHTATEDMDGHLFDDKPQAETWFREQGFEIRENPDPTEITVSDDMLHESVIYLTYGENCCRVDGCDTRALDRLVDCSNYELVYEGPVPQECAGMTDPELILNSIYYQMNMQHPDGYRGASMSMSDVVALTQDGKTTCYYTDRIGFRQLDDFLTKENPLRNAEMALEDDYGMIDGIINNGPRQEEPRTSVRDALKECRSKASKAEHPHPERTTHKENER